MKKNREKFSHQKKKKNNQVNPNHAKIYSTKSIQTKMLVANHQVTHLHLASNTYSHKPGHLATIFSGKRTRNLCELLEL